MTEAVALDWVEQHARRHPDAPALSDLTSGAHLTWAELEDRVGRLATVLRGDLGLVRGDRLALLAENDNRVLELQFACMRAGIVLVPLNWRLALPELLALASDAEPGAICYDGDWAGVGEQLADGTGLQQRLCWGARHNVSDYESALRDAPHREAEGVALLSDPTHILYTSGTTGLPKGVLCTHGTLVWHAVNLAHTSGMAERGNHHLNLVPLFHAGGLNVYTNPILYWGGHVSSLRRFNPAEALGLLTSAAAGITHMCGVQQMYELMTALPEFAEASFPTLRCALFGGWGPSAHAVHRAWRERGLVLQLSYGGTEMGPLVTVESGEDAEVVDRGSSGRVLPHTQVRLVDDTGSDVANGEVGEIWVRGPSVTPGYWARTADTACTDGWYRSGDAAWRDASGRYYVVDRIKEMYRSGGENVFPAEVEAVLSEAPGVRELAVIGVPDRRWGEVGLVIVAPHPGAVVTLENLRHFAEDRLARYKLPVHLRIVDELPRNVTAKIARDELRRRFPVDA